MSFRGYSSIGMTATPLTGLIDLASAGTLSVRRPTTGRRLVVSRGCRGRHRRPAAAPPPTGIPRALGPPLIEGDGLAGRTGRPRAGRPARCGVRRGRHPATSRVRRLRDALDRLLLLEV